MTNSFATLIAGLGICYAGGAVLSENLKNITSGGFHQLVHRCAKNGWIAAAWGLVFNMVVGRASLLALVVVGLISGRFITVSQAFPMIIWGNVGGTVMIYMVTINMKMLALCAIALTGTAYGFRKKISQKNLVGALFGIGLLIYGIVTVKEIGSDAFHADWIQSLFEKFEGSLLMALLIGCFLKLTVQSGLVIALLEIKLAEAGIINLAQVISIFIGSRIATSALNWLFSAPHEGESKQLVMLQVFYNLLGSFVFLTLLYIEEWCSVALVQSLLEASSDDLAIQIANLAMLVCFTTSSLSMALKVPLLKKIESFWPISEENDPSEPRFINRAALGNPETAMDLALREQSDLLARLPETIAVIRQLAEGEDLNRKLESNHLAFRDLCHKTQRFLTEISNQTLSQDAFQRFLSIQEAHGILASLEAQIHELGVDSHWSDSSSELNRILLQFLESGEFIVGAVADAFENRTLSDIEMLKQLTKNKNPLIEKLRDRCLSNENLSEEERSKVLDLTLLYEKIAWLVYMFSETIERISKMEEHTMGNR